MRMRTQWIILVGLAGVWGWAGCGPKGTRIELTTFDEAGQAQCHYAEVTWSSYRNTPGGLPELVLRTQTPSRIDPTQTITQIVHVKTFWLPRPGTTYAEATQINASIQYAILTPPTGVRYDGAGFVSYKIDKRTGVMTGRIESSTLAPRCRMGDAVEPFGPVRLAGRFRATENPRDVVNTAQMLEAQFSKRPRPGGQKSSGK